MTDFQIRSCTDEDRDRIFEIRNDVIRTSAAILEDEPWGENRWNEWWAKRPKDLPFLVLTSPSGHVEGYAVLAYFGDRAGYRVTGEVSIHLDPAVRGKGLGKKLFEELIEAGRAFGFHSLISRITAENVASVRLHEGLGFKKAGHLVEVARKFGRLIDVTLYQLHFFKSE